MTKTGCTVRIDSGYYERNHGAKPRGFGSWAFAEEHKAARADGADIFWAHGSTYGDAKKKATAHFKALGAGRGELNLFISVLP